MFHEVSMNSYSIDAIFGEDKGAFNQPEIIELNQSLPRQRVHLMLNGIGISYPVGHAHSCHMHISEAFFQQ